jgi:hypothetical protein
MAAVWLKGAALNLLLLLQRLLGEHGEIHLSALGMAVSTMVSIAEILKKDGLAVETREQQLQQLPTLSPAQQRTLLQSQLHRKVDGGCWPSYCSSAPASSSNALQIMSAL